MQLISPGKFPALLGRNPGSGLALGFILWITKTLVMRGVKWFLFFLILLLLVIPVIQSQFHVFAEKPIVGYFKPADPPGFKKLNLAIWNNSSFQDDFSSKINQNLGLRPLLFRINNQLDYSLYGLTHAEGFIKGKNGYLFQEEYIMEYTGQFFIGKSAIQKKLWKLKDVQDSLAAHGIHLLVVIEPGKATRITHADIGVIEKEMDRITALLPEIKNFALPGGTPAACQIHIARTVARRAEREALAVADPAPVEQTPMIFLNRLSDYLYLLARYENHLAGAVETDWIPES